MTAENQSYKLLLYITGMFTLVISIIAFINPPAIYPDPSWGFQVLRGMRLGGGFNMLPSVNQADITKNAPFFLSWWSPGQYLAPGIFMYIFGFNNGQAMVLVSALCSLLGLWGFYCLFTKLGFSKKIAALSVVFIATQEFFFIPFVFYNGGEVLLFGFSGWFLYGCISFNKPNWPMAIFILLSGLIGFFCKSAFMWMYAAGLLVLWLRLSVPSKKITTWLITGIWLVIPFAVAVAVIYLSYLSKGLNPAGGGEGLKLVWETFCFPLAAPILAGFSIDEMCNGLIYHTDAAIFNRFWTIVVLVALVTLSIFLVVQLAKKNQNRDYRLLVIIFYSICVAFFGLSFLRQAEISYEARHMRIIGLIIIPGTIQLITKSKQVVRVLFGIIWLVIFWHAMRFLITGHQRNTTQAVHGKSGIAQLFADKPTLDYLTAADAAERNAVFVFNSPDLGLEINHNRIITLDPLFEIPSPLPESFRHEGHGGPLYLLMPAYYKGLRATLLMQSFPGYHHFVLVKATNNFMVYRAE